MWSQLNARIRQLLGQRFISAPEGTHSPPISDAARYFAATTEIVMNAIDLDDFDKADEFAQGEEVYIVGECPGGYCSAFAHYTGRRVQAVNDYENISVPVFLIPSGTFPDGFAMMSVFKVHPQEHNPI